MVKLNESKPNYFTKQRIIVNTNPNAFKLINLIAQQYHKLIWTDYLIALRINYIQENKHQHKNFSIWSCHIMLIRTNRCTSLEERSPALVTRKLWSNKKSKYNQNRRKLCHEEYLSQAKGIHTQKETHKKIEFSHQKLLSISVNN